MALKYLLDTSVLTRLHHSEVRNAVRALAVAGEVGVGEALLEAVAAAVVALVTL